LETAAPGKPCAVKTLLRGLAAGLVGTGAMTAAQLAAAKVRGRSSGTGVPGRRADASTPVAKDGAPLLTNTMHWTYGTTLGVLYAIAARVLRPQPFLGGVGFGLGVWSASYAQLVPFGIYDPPWRYPADEVLLDLGYHVVYGAAVAGAFAAAGGDA
jgi:hypothetical protein